MNTSDGGQATLSDLKEVLKDTLAARGSLDQIKARIRAEIFAALDDQEVPKPKLSNENLIINELVREYFEYNGYRHALSVFLPESGQPAEKPFDRQFLSSELNVVEDPRFKHVPLLYSIVASLQQSRNQAQERARDQNVQHQLNQFGTTASRRNLNEEPIRQAPASTSSTNPPDAKIHFFLCTHNIIIGLFSRWYQYYGTSDISKVTKKRQTLSQVEPLSYVVYTTRSQSSSPFVGILLV